MRLFENFGFGKTPTAKQERERLEQQRQALLVNKRSIEAFGFSHPDDVARAEELDGKIATIDRQLEELEK